MPGLPEEAYPALQKALGNTLQVAGYGMGGPEGDLIRCHVAQLGRFSPRLFRKLKLKGLKRIEIGPGSVADFPGYEHLANTQAIGHPEGMTFSDVAGGYDSMQNRLILGTRGMEVRGLVPHEMGHVLGDLLGFYNDDTLTRSYSRNAKNGNLDAYYLDGGEPSPRGLQEFFADLVMSAILRGKVPERYGSEIHNLIFGKILRGL